MISITSSTLVLLDANVLYPFTLRDTLLRVAEQRFYQPRWTATILDEVTRNLIKNQQVTPAQAERLAAVMTRAFPSAQVEGYQHRVSMMANEAKDRHVAAAAVHAGCAIIMTQNLRDFSPLPPGVCAMSADDFLCRLAESIGEDLVSILEEQASDLVSPPQTLDDVLCGLSSVVPRFVAFAERRLRARPTPGLARLILTQ